MHRLRFAAVWFVAFIVVVPIAGAAWTSPNSWTETILYSFPLTAVQPQSGIIQGSDGALYGTQSAGLLGGSVYRLNPPAPGQTIWTQTILHTFTGAPDGSGPVGGLLMDKSGALYGTTYYGGTAACLGGLGCGVVYKLTPPAPGHTGWTESILHDFAYSEGRSPTSALVADAQGNLFGTAIAAGAKNHGTVFELSPGRAGGAWTFTLLYSFFGNDTFPNPIDGAWPLGITLGSNGVIYGTTLQGGSGNNGVVYALAPPAVRGAAWSERVLYFFLGQSDGYSPNGNLVIDNTGALYGTTYHGGSTAGTVFKLSPPAPGNNVWTKSTLYAFASGDAGYPLSGVTAYPGGVLFGTGSWRGPGGEGIAYILEPPTATRPAWKYGAIHYFGGRGDGASPRTQLIVGPHGILYGTTLFGGLYGGGTIFALVHH